MNNLKPLQRRNDIVRLTPKSHQFHCIISNWYLDRYRLTLNNGMESTGPSYLITFSGIRLHRQLLSDYNRYRLLNNIFSCIRWKCIFLCWPGNGRSALRAPILLVKLPMHRWFLKMLSDMRVLYFPFRCSKSTCIYPDTSAKTSVSHNQETIVGFSDLQLKC
jgi:hypothetical protein